MSPRRRLLFLCHTMPYPPDGGVWIRAYNLLRLLASEFDVTLLCFERAVPKAYGPRDADTEGVPLLEELVEDLQVFPIPQKHRFARKLWDHLRSFVRRRVFTEYLYESRDFESAVAQVLRSRSYDLVHVDSLDLARYLPMLEGLPVVCAHHNVESELLGRRARADTSSLRRVYIRIQARFMRELEREWCPRVALNVTVSSRDAATLERIADGGRYAVVPNGVDADYFRAGHGELRKDVVFVGGANWFPNRDALEYFCGSVLPLLRARHPDLGVQWVGAARPEERERFERDFGVKLTGYVSDVRPYIRSASCYVAPLRVGGGTRIKILVAWAMGKAVVSTQVGCEGLEARDGDNILIADTAADFAHAVDRLLDDRALAARLGASGRRTVERRYSWQVIGEDLLPLYRTLAKTAPVKPRAARTQIASR